MAKKVIQRTVNIASGDSVNVLSGTRFENVYTTGLLTLLAISSVDSVTAELFVADRISMERSDVTVAAAPLLAPDHVVVDDVEAYVGDKIQLQVTNNNAGATDFIFRLILDDNVAVV